MNEPKVILHRGTKIIIHDSIGPCYGIYVKDNFIANRKPGGPGIILGYVPGHGGDIYWVFHGNELPANLKEIKDEDVGVYGWMEFELFESHPNSCQEIFLDNSCSVCNNTFVII